MQLIHKVDSYRFLTGISRRLIKSWVGLEEPREIPWTALTKPLRECRVALISSAALSLNSDKSFDQEIERRNPWISDPSFRVIPRRATATDVRSYHLHIDPKFIHQDLNCALPLTRLTELEDSGEIGRAAESHYSYSGYTCMPEHLIRESVPAMIASMREEAVDVVALVPI